MAFEITPNVKVKRDKDGVVRQLHHPRQAYTTEVSAEAVNVTDSSSEDRRALAEQYLRDVLPILRLDSEIVSDLNGAISEQIADEGPRLRFAREKVLPDQTTISYAQTFLGLPVWEAGVTVRMRGAPQRVTGSHNGMHYDIDVHPPTNDALYMPENIDVQTLARLLALNEDELPVISSKELMIYRYEAANRGACTHDEDDECQMHVASPVLHPPAVPDNVKDGDHFVVADIKFTLSQDGWDQVNWSAFIEPQTGAVLYLRAFTGCFNGFVYLRDPLTATGDTSIQPNSSTAVLNNARDRVLLEGLTTANPQDLRGEFVRMENITPPNSPAPTETTPNDFLYNVPTDDFSAVNAYYHCDRLFRMMQDMGFDVAAYFDGTTFPVRVDHRATFNGRTNVVNAQAPGNAMGNGSDGFRFALIMTNTSVGIALDWRVVLHEFGHTIMWDNVNSPNFRFAHSAGDSLAAILNDAGSNALDRGRTFPWTPITRRHDRPVSTWAFGGPNDDTLPVGHPASSDRAGYDREQILSTTLFRLYRALGGDHTDVDVRRFAARYTVYLVYSSVGSMTQFAQPDDAEEFADMMIDIDMGITQFEGHAGGVTHKVIRWAFEQQGVYQPAGAPGNVTTVGAPPEVDVYIDDGRGGEYTPDDRMVLDTNDAWVRQQADNGTAHQQPVKDEANSVYVRVSNRGSAPAQNTRVTVYSTAPTSGDAENAAWPNDWIQIGVTNSAQIPAGGSTVIGPVSWTPTTEGDASLMFSVTADNDESNLQTVSGTVDTPWLVHCDNNIAVRKVTVAAAEPNDPVEAGNRVEATPNTPIPDKNPIGISDQVTFPHAGAITKIDVSVDIEHTYIGDLRVTLTSPGGTEIVLHNRSGRETDNLVSTWSSDTNSDLASLIGEPSQNTWTLKVADLIGQDTGTLRKWSIDIERGTTVVIDRDSSPHAAIPDNNDNGITDTISIAQLGLVGSVIVGVNIEHTYVGDLVVSLSSPSGDTVVLHNRKGHGQDNLIKTWTPADLPVLMAFANTPINGDWQLSVADTLADDTGTLKNWFVSIQFAPA